MFATSGFRLFSLWDVEVSASFSAIFLIVLCVLWYGAAFGLLASVAIAASIIIHEFGHAMVCKRYDLGPSIILHGLGGVCYHRPASSDGREALIAAAGPLLQVLVGALALGALTLVATPMALAEGAIGSGAGAQVIRGFDQVLRFSASVFAFFSIFWGLVNLLLPIWPLDGGKLFPLLLRRFVAEDTARTWTLRIGMALLVPLGVWALMQRSLLLGFICVSIFFENYRLLASGEPLFAHGSGRRVKKKASEYTIDLLERARQAYAEEDWREAARLCHQIRASSGPIPPKMMDEIWELLGLATAHQGEHEEAIAWLEHAPKNPTVEDVLAECRREVEQES